MYHRNGSSRKTCFRFFMSSHAVCTASGDTRVKSRRIRVYPTHEQRKLFRQWFGVARKVYNTSVEYYNREDKPTVAWMAVAKTVLSELSEDYVKSVPYQIKKMAVRDCYNAFRNGCSKAKRSGVGFRLSFRSRKEPRQSCYIPKSALSDSGIYRTISGRLKIKEKELLRNGWQDLRLVCEYGRWYLSVPVIVDMTQGGESQAPEDVVALDPGIRSFITYFSEEGRLGHVGNGSFQRILGYHSKMEKLISKRSTTDDKKRRRNLYRRIERIRLKIRDLVDEMQWKTADFLTGNFGVIILPTFNTSEMVRRDGRNLRKTTVKAMQSLRFYEFSQRLAQKCSERGVLLVRSNEAYTSRTNSLNGDIMRIGGRKSFRYDGVTVDRDINGARNILIRAMRDSSATAEMRSVD